MLVSTEAIVRKLSGAANGVASSDWLAKKLECMPEDLAGPLAELHDSGMALVWPAAPGVLGVVLASTTRPRRRRRTGGFRVGVTLTGLDLDRLPDRRSVAVADRDPCGVPYPGFVPLGERLIWDGETTHARPCRGCGGRRVPISVESYCLLCDRAGRTPATWGVRPGPEAPVRLRTPDDGLAGGRGDQPEADPAAAATLQLEAEREKAERERLSRRARQRRRA